MTISFSQGQAIKAESNNQLTLKFGGYSNKGVRDENQDAIIVKYPKTRSEQELKGSVACIADGASCSEHGQKASHTSVMQFIDDYYATPKSWSIQRSAQKVLTSLNSWLFNSSVSNIHPTQQVNHNALVSTFSSVILKSNTAHLFHVGDSRIYLLRDGELRQLTRDHTRKNMGQKHYLTRALGMDNQLNVDYQTLAIKKNDRFILTSDGVHEFVSPNTFREHIDKPNVDFEHAAQSICNTALSHNSSDNVSCLIVEVTQLPTPSLIEFHEKLSKRAIPPALKLGQSIDNFMVLEVLYAGSRSHVYRVMQKGTQTEFVLKVPSVQYHDDPTQLTAFFNEQWAGILLNNKKVMKVYPTPEHSHFLYQICELVEGVTLRQWMYDNPNPSLEQVREILDKITQGVRVLQRADMVHRDLKPENIMIQRDGDIKIIDLGAVLVRGIEEGEQTEKDSTPLGAVNYIAPETIKYNTATTSSDLFSIAVIGYEMLTGELPYSEMTVQSLAQSRHHQWEYQPLTQKRTDLPAWIDLVLQKACAESPNERYQVLGDFVTDLYTPNQSLIKHKAKQPLINRNPIQFWKVLALLLGVVAIVELGLLLNLN
ncbi:protein kinase [Vibrio sp. 10N.261.46.E12]|uniref:bifunctional protein-serine/threonine kinase/phosphatase n=1 Tax=unclassified Vibrio TaxID=2614977 RepID=UPI0009763628|nr:MULTISPECIES: bifunctional protein-serine/threonine kinase/phosphatase [unclassified Vibrio]OMO38236.1 serine/threonine protein kinase [Vibrio sp. 10N.261.45.E1]PMJ25166.1 serine/threonine protein kinase [Vibrio sp. 10N.286.45.B6]PML88353.1 serine/threonine protein kinase [Vibrio sp. 10N.261.49.E11]PMM70861.1 serine/threonine protein kinase [Vibrio sp. 10N.261.46.F12]PMM80939.1 serine/threonine protein kinase [Vibrio sp. 10N.261.46.E8]